MTSDDVVVAQTKAIREIAAAVTEVAALLNKHLDLHHEGEADEPGSSATPDPTR